MEDNCDSRRGVAYVSHLNCNFEFCGKFYNQNNYIWNQHPYCRFYARVRSCVLKCKNSNSWNFSYFFPLKSNLFILMSTFNFSKMFDQNHSFTINIWLSFFKATKPTECTKRLNTLDAFKSQNRSACLELFCSSKCEMQLQLPDLKHFSRLTRWF